MGSETPVDVPPLRVFAANDPTRKATGVSGGASRVRRWLADYWPLLLALSGFLALAASDLQGGANEFWRQHEVITSLVTGAALTLAVVFGVDRVLRTRSRERWRPIGMRIVKTLNFYVGAEETLYFGALSYYERTYGEPELPPDRAYFEVLLEALGDRRTWEPGSDCPALLDQIDEERSDLEKAIETWAPVLISEPELAAVGAGAEKLLDAITSIRGALAFGLAIEEIDGERAWVPGSKPTLWLLAGLQAHADAVGDLNTLAAAYH